MIHLALFILASIVVLYVLVAIVGYLVGAFADSVNGYKAWRYKTFGVPVEVLVERFRLAQTENRLSEDDHRIVVAYMSKPQNGNVTYNAAAAVLHAAQALEKKPYSLCLAEQRSYEAKAERKAELAAHRAWKAELRAEHRAKYVKARK